MLPHHPNKICVPDYENSENYQAFLDLMTEDDRMTTKPWQEYQALRAEMLATDSSTKIPVVSVPVTADRWRRWCDARQFEYSPLTVGYYATWLYLGHEVE